ncbi:flavin monoamine oxidase family protein [Chromobacterium vaccinii]|uniref:flavin monoamine oxidase family protein n=1 Tax=Chromobacterium vaccinii TaxID=1108595 RepID=UPI000E18B479|nr:FAD-dependent oxidoreductase [Chromobacterium vaccinii]SUX54155.1 protoporphyrinogen oxidase [Chromobacterium vaccinii]
MAEENFDIAIVGGGVSGVYCAWRLKQTNPGQKIAVFEASDHIGGRLLSVRPPDIPDMVAELGGMRILPAVQPLVTKLITELNQELPADEQITLYKFPVDEPQNIAFLRGVYLRLADFTNDPDIVPYQLNFIDHGQSAGEVIVNAIEQIVPGITNSNLNEEQRREMAQSAEFGGVPLYKQGFWNVLLRVITGEAYHYAEDVGGYDSTLCNWNAADAIPWYLSDFGVSPEYMGFSNGFQQVPLSLAQLFEKSGGDLRLASHISHITLQGDGFAFQVNGSAATAKKLILAMPRRSLELLTATSPALQDAKTQALISTVTPRPLFKLFTTYDSPGGATPATPPPTPRANRSTSRCRPAARSPTCRCGKPTIGRKAMAPPPPKATRCCWPATTTATTPASGTGCAPSAASPERSAGMWHSWPIPSSAWTTMCSATSWSGTSTRRRG